ncbi:MAG: zinc-dependent peptidase [Pseudomonadales bacterium]
MGLLDGWRGWRRRRLLERHAIDDARWQRILAASPLFDRLTDAERNRLRELTTLFLASKRFFGAHGLAVDDDMRVSVASRACLLVLGLHDGLDYYRGWYTIVLYPGGFVAEREVEDEFGVVHSGYEELDGESMAGGAVVLNWEEAQPRRADPDSNREPGDDPEPVDVVIHEFAHKLDERNGEANGLPPLPADMSVAEWAEVFNAAYERFIDWTDAGVQLPFDDYAATHPAEFFSVATEAFLLAPRRLRDALPDVYQQLARFYRQDPAAA